MRHIEGTYQIARHTYYIENIISERNVHQPTIVFLHDALGSVKSWKTFPIELCQLLEVNGLLYDRLGHGQSGPSELPWKKGYMEVEAFEVLPQVLARFNIRDPILLGISDGGSIALLYASQYSDLKALISISGHIKVEKETQAGVAATTHEPIASKLKIGLKKYHGDQALPLFARWQSTWMSDAFADWNITDKLPGISVPSLILQGAQDQYATVQHCYDIAAGIGPHAQAVIIEQCGHFPTREQPQTTMQLIKEFINSLL